VRLLASLFHWICISVQWRSVISSYTEATHSNPMCRLHSCFPQAIMLCSPMNSHVSPQLSSSYLSVVTNPEIPITKMKTQASLLWMKSFLFCYHTWKHIISCFNVYGFVMYLWYHGLSFLWYSCVGNSDLKCSPTLENEQYSTHYSHEIIFTHTVLDTYEEHVDYSVNVYQMLHLDQTQTFKSKALVRTVYSLSM